jgi:hypothetical protein
MSKNERHHNLAVLFQVTNRYFIALLYSVSKKNFTRTKTEIEALFIQIFSKFSCELFIVYSDFF